MIRDFAGPDLSAAVDLLDLASPSDTRTRWHRLLTGPGAHALVAEEDGQLAGAAVLTTAPDYRGQRAIGLGVRELSRGRGIGTALAAALARADGADGADRGDRATADPGPIAVTVRDDLPRGRRFAERLGLSVVNHCTGWTIALDDLAGLRAAVSEAATHAGVRLEVTTVGRARARFVAAAADSLAGMPSDTPIDLTAFAANMPDDVVLLFATDAGGEAGVALIRRDGDTGGWHTSYTGVATRCRRRGVARALKLGTFAAAAERGGTSMHGENDDRNAPMLALSAAVGMRRGLGYWSMAGDRLTAPSRS